MARKRRKKSQKNTKHNNNKTKPQNKTKNLQQVTRTFRSKQNKTNNKTPKVMSISFSYKSITDSCEGNKFSKISTVSTDPVSCTTQNTLLSYKEASCELSWVLSHILWYSLSEQQELGRVLGVEVRYKEGRGQCIEGRCPERRGLHIWTHLVEEVDGDELQ